ncbi:MAG: gamma-glutamyl-gamma-aminobutyrate hydrolase family protein [Deltaproteobacteria bacterium]|nr:gamma-glutamyl-gamma-aminobutyrate hydrolase family protein [Deltaproteobacteria bacterium]
MPQRPRIGITTYHREGEVRLAFSLPSAYVDAVRVGGGMPLLLPPGETRPAVMLDYVDGLVFGGGGDLDPAHFEGESHDTNYFVDPERDVFELELMRAALERRTPVLAICRGMQVLNVVRGGGLHAHLPDALGEEVCHRESQQAHTHHPVRLELDSHLGRIYEAPELDVASWHHQAVDRLGDGLRAVAWAPDGAVEAVEDPERPELLAVQWHPELQLEDGSPQLRLFQAFSKAAEKRI